MLQTDRFALQGIQRHPFLQPDCPVYVHCTRQSEERTSGARFLQLRMVNCGQSSVETVIFDVEGRNSLGETSFVQRGLVMTGCHAEPGKIFGEGRVFALNRQFVRGFCITVRQVIFADGMSWKMLPTHKLTTAAEAGWTVCQCGMPNPPQSSNCKFCKTKLMEDVAETKEEAVETALPIPQMEVRPTPAVRREAPLPVQQELWQDWEDEEEEEDEGVPIWLSVLLCVFGTLALLALLAFGAFFLHQYIL